MKARKFWIVPAAFCLLMLFAIIRPTDAQAASKSAMKTAFAASVSETVQSVYYNDYDADGEKEAFFVTVSAKKKTARNLYFMSSEKEITKLKAGLDESVTFSTIALKSTTFFSVNEEVTYTTLQTLYHVDGTDATKIFAGYNIKVKSGNKFTADANAYDSVKKNSTGTLFAHSAKPYYFYYDKSAGKVRQYTAVKISRSKFLKRYKNAKTMLKKYEKKYGSVKSILVRENGRVHVNFKQSKNGYTYYTNVTFNTNGKRLKNPKVNTGTYKKKLKDASLTIKSQSVKKYKRSKIVNTARKFLGYKESNNSHRVIIDLYNANRPWAVNYKVKYNDAWCATFVSAVAVLTGYTDIIPTECGCDRMIELLQEMDAWEEKDSYVPKKGDLIFYDWNDSGKGDCTGDTEHVGIVLSVSGSTIKVIEGNYKDSVKIRTIKVNGRYIRGYGVPAYN